MSIALQKATHYFDIAELETKCGETLVSTLDINCNFNSIITFAVEQQLDLLLTQCLHGVNGGQYREGYKQSMVQYFAFACNSYLCEVL